MLRLDEALRLIVKLREGCAGSEVAARLESSFFKGGAMEVL